MITYRHYATPLYGYNRTTELLLMIAYQVVLRLQQERPYPPEVLTIPHPGASTSECRSRRQILFPRIAVESSASQNIP